MQNISDDKLLKAIEQLKLSSVPEDAELRQICSIVFHCQIEQTTTLQFVTVGSMLAQEMAKRYKKLRAFHI
jgi:hypothetical protein